jgi:hypothetical protein
MKLFKKNKKIPIKINYEDGTSDTIYINQKRFKQLCINALSENMSIENYIIKLAMDKAEEDLNE